MHHGDTPDDSLREQAEKLGLGPTGEFPQGQLNEHDEGEIRLGVGVQDGKVVLNFGKPVVWIGMDPRQARQLAESLRQASHRAKGR